MQGNPIGGRKQGFAQAGSLHVKAIADLENKFGWCGADLVVSALYRSGVNLSSRYIDNIFFASQIYSGETWWLNSLYLEQRLCHNRILLRIGRLDIGGNFAYSPLYENFVNSGINDFIGSISENVFFHDNPYATWAAALYYHFSPCFYAKFAFYNANEEVTNNAYNGFNFQFKNTQGVAWITEWTFEPKPHSLPGHYSAGGYYYNGKFDRFLGGKTRGNWGYYFMADQALYRFESGGHLIPFATFAYAPKGYNLLPLFSSGGIIAEGPFSCRPDDVAGVAIIYGSFSSDLRAIQRLGISPEYGDQPQNFEMVLEATYAFQINKYLVFQPDIQYIIKPSGRSDIENALVLGIQLIAEF